MTSIIINNFYRALLRIEEEEGFAKYNAKTLAVRLVDDLYPEDGYISLEDDPRGTLRVHLDDKFLDRVREQIAKGLNLKEATEAIGFKEEPPKQEAVVPAEVKEVKVKPKVSKEEKARKEAEKAAKAAAKAKPKEADPVAALTEKLAEVTIAPKKAPAKAKFVGNLEKMNATHEKLWKKVAAEHKIELTDNHKKKFLEQVNALDNSVYNLKKLEVHMAEFFKPKEPELKTEPLEMDPVEFKGKEYWVTADGRVWEDFKQDDGSIVQKHVGRVGQLAFGDLEMPSA